MGASIKKKVAFEKGLLNTEFADLGDFWSAFELEQEL